MPILPDVLTPADGYKRLKQLQDGMFRTVDRFQGRLSSKKATYLDAISCRNSLLAAYMDWQEVSNISGMTEYLKTQGLPDDFDLNEQLDEVLYPVAAVVGALIRSKLVQPDERRNEIIGYAYDNPLSPDASTISPAKIDDYSEWNDVIAAINDLKAILT